MKIDSRRVALFLALVLLSVGFGFAYDGIATAIEKHRYPRPSAYRTLIAQAAEEAGLPEAVIYSVIHLVSDFDGGGKDESGGVGLFRLTYGRLCTIYAELLQEPAPDVGMLYDPATNLRAGCAYLSDLYRRYGTWEPVYAAWQIGTEQVDTWIVDPNRLNAQGKLVKIPDPAVQTFVSNAVKGQKLYTSLYYQ